MTANLNETLLARDPANEEGSLRYDGQPASTQNRTARTKAFWAANEMQNRPELTSGQKRGPIIKSRLGSAMNTASSKPQYNRKRPKDFVANRLAGETLTAEANAFHGMTLDVIRCAAVGGPCEMGSRRISYWNPIKIQYIWPSRGEEFAKFVCLRHEY